MRQRHPSAQSVTPMLDRAVKVAFRTLDAAGGDARRLPVPMATVVCVYGAQGVIDNGGFQYFFENDWPCQPPYSMFWKAYARIGAHEAAAAIESAVALFPFARPHRSRAKREAFMAARSRSDRFFRLDTVCGDATVWPKLEAYVRANASAFWKRPPTVAAPS